MMLSFISPEGWRRAGGLAAIRGEGAIVITCSLKAGQHVWLPTPFPLASHRRRLLQQSL